MGRASMGVMGIRPRESDFVVGLAIVTEGCTLLVASENGLGKRTPFDDYRKQSRGGKGIITMKVTDKTGPVVGAVTVTEEDELMLMTSTGQSIRIRVNEIRETGRNAQGVKLLTLKGKRKTPGRFHRHPGWRGLRRAKTHPARKSKAKPKQARTKQQSDPLMSSAVIQHPPHARGTSIHSACSAKPAAPDFFRVLVGAKRAVLCGCPGLPRKRGSRAA